MAERPIRSGGRVHLRRIVAGDGEAFLAAVDRSRRLHRGWVALPETPEQFAAYLRRSRRRDVVSYVICRNGDHALAGAATLSQIFLGPLRSAYLGFSAFVPLAGHGYMDEGLRLVLRDAFDRIGLHRVEANVQPDNERSIALVEGRASVAKATRPGT